ncbi:U6 snRNA-associated Sm-like protein LSm6 [Diplonema papillatum]|nr:U6 snRNA-associated Sm-like protein LSm6 [Diplonema papillatum]
MSAKDVAPTEEAVPAAAAEAVIVSKPANFVEEAVGKRVSVKLAHGSEYRGLLACMDGLMNITMQDTEEYRGGLLRKRYGDAFLRGNNATDQHETTQKKSQAPGSS